MANIQTQQNLFEMLGHPSDFKKLMETTEMLSGMTSPQVMSTIYGLTRQNGVGLSTAYGVGLTNGIEFSTSPPYERRFPMNVRVVGTDGNPYFCDERIDPRTRGVDALSNYLDIISNSDAPDLSVHLLGFADGILRSTEGDSMEQYHAVARRAIEMSGLAGTRYVQERYAKIL